MDLVHLIASAIKEADKGFFFEDYDRQALNVLKILKKSGYTMLPISPTDNMIKAGKQAISYGHTSPSELIKNIYKAIVESEPT